jgi:glutamate-1-semialdehyde 2,1-aminomutase
VISDPVKDLLASAVAQAKSSYSVRNPRSQERWQSAVRAMPGGNTRSVLFFSPFPICMERGEGSYLYDVDGHRYVDLLGEYTAGIYGHSNPTIRAAIVDALENGISLAAQTRAESDLANLICERFDSIDLIRFTNSGSEANLMAITTAIACTGRRRIMVFSGAYHGGLLSFGSETASAMNVPYDFIVAPYNDTNAVRALIGQHREHLAAVLVEPMLGAGGCIPAKPDFLRMLREETTAAEATLIFDEIQTSRLSLGGRQKVLGIRPDLTTLGKYLGGGLSFGAFGGRAALMEQFDPRRPSFISHAGTFNNNVLSMAAGYAGLSRVLLPEVLADLNQRGERLMAALNTLFEEEASDFFVTGLGSIMNIHCRREARRSDVMQLLFFALLEQGFYIAPRGMIALSLAVSPAQIEQFLAAVKAILLSKKQLLSLPS